MKTEQLRDAYYVLRAMHDGACPKCGHTGEAESFKKGDCLYCPHCAFHMSGKVIAGIKAMVPDIMERRVKNFFLIEKELERQ